MAFPAEQLSTLDKKRMWDFCQPNNFPTGTPVWIDKEGKYSLTSCKGFQRGEYNKFLGIKYCVDTDCKFLHIEDKFFNTPHEAVLFAIEVERNKINI